MNVLVVIIVKVEQIREKEADVIEMKEVEEKDQKEAVDVEVIADRVEATEEAVETVPVVAETVAAVVDQGKNRGQFQKGKAGKNRTFAQLFSKVSSKG